MNSTETQTAEPIASDHFTPIVNPKATVLYKNPRFSVSWALATLRHAGAPVGSALRTQAQEDAQVETQRHPPTPTPQTLSAVERVQELLDELPSRGPCWTMERLIGAFGLGDRPALRRLAYKRIISVLRTNGPLAAKLVGDVARSAYARRDPGRYFVAVCARRLAESGFHPQE